MLPRVIAPAALVAVLLAASAARAQTVVADCAPDTVVAAATGARRALLERARTFHSWAPDYQQANCMNFDTGAVAPRGTAACAAPTWWRTDCSGFVSATWSLAKSLDTDELAEGGSSGSRTWATKAWNALEPGDAINEPDDHTAIFTGWLDAAETQFCVFEEVHAAYTDPWGGLGCIADAHTTATYQAFGFVPIGLVGIDAPDGGADADVARDAAASFDGSVGEIVGLAERAPGTRPATVAVAVAKSGCAAGSREAPEGARDALWIMCVVACGVASRARARRSER